MRPASHRGVLLVGHKKCGKDTAGKYLSQVTQVGYGGSTSDIIAKHISLTEGVPLPDVYAEKETERDKWRQIGDEMRALDPTYLARAALDKGPIINGVRSLEEMTEIVNNLVVSDIIWISRDTPPDSTLDFDLATLERIIQDSEKTPDLYVVFNKGPAELFKLRLLSLCKQVLMLNTQYFQEHHMENVNKCYAELHSQGFV